MNMQFQIILPKYNAFEGSDIEAQYLTLAFSDDVLEEGTRSYFTQKGSPPMVETFRRMRSTQFDSIEYVVAVNRSRIALGVVVTSTQHYRNLIRLLGELADFGATLVMRGTQRKENFDIVEMRNLLICGPMSDPDEID